MTTKITNIKIRKLYPSGNVKALISIILNNEIAIHEIKIVQGNEKLFVAMPNRKDENGVYRDIIHPINVEMRKDMEKQILDEYHRCIRSIDCYE